MRLTFHADYTLRLLMYLALTPDRLTTVEEIAKTFGISKIHMMKVAHGLGRAGYVETVRGRSGGLRLKPDAANIRIGDVVRAMVRDAAWPVVAGLCVGLLGAYYASRIVASFLFETTPHDPTTLASAVGLLGIAACLAAWIPARRAAFVNPVEALRVD